jgi:sortase A
VRQRAKIGALDDHQRQRWLTVSSWVRNIGAIILLFVAWQLWGTAIAQQHSQNTLGNQFQTELHGAKIKQSPNSSLIPATTRIADTPSGTVMAQLQIPAISLSQYVVSGTADPDLAKGPGHYLGTAMPGQAGNVAIAGHRTTHGAPFNRIGQLTVGNRIYLTTLRGQRLTYVVAEAPFIVSPSNVAVLNNFGDNRLTLTTCNPEFSSRQRLVVVAGYLPPGATRPSLIAKVAGTPYGLAPADAIGWNLGQMPLVLVEMAALIGLGLGFRRLSGIYGRNTRWLILIPVWIALLVALFETLVNVLPASV